jgi:hypothetical protein
MKKLLALLIPRTLVRVHPAMPRHPSVESSCQYPSLKKIMARLGRSSEFDRLVRDCSSRELERLEGIAENNPGMLELALAATNCLPTGSAEVSV